MDYLLCLPIKTVHYKKERKILKFSKNRRRKAKKVAKLLICEYLKC